MGLTDANDAIPSPIIQVENPLQYPQERHSGFDYMRLVLALGVIIYHCELITGKDFNGLWKHLVAPLARMILPMFFTLSGFLVAGSLERSRTLITFLGLRIMRLMPALTVEVVLSALILGPIFTEKPLNDYFSSTEFSHYFLNIVGDVHFKLPGVFTHAPDTNVNPQLWTIPSELTCYIILTLLAVYNIFNNRKRLLIVFFITLIFQIGCFFSGYHESDIADQKVLVMSFITGLALYRYHGMILWSNARCLRMLVFSFILLNIDEGVRFAIIPIAYVTIHLGFLNPPRNRILLSGDYSYGMYLYGFPIQQAVYAMFPFCHSWYGNLLVAIPCTITVAVLSWWLVERPILKQKHRLKKLEEWYVKITSNLHALRRKIVR